jgi:dipeptidyl aminopeptidase/acylaminoacyl peptidase
MNAQRMMLRAARVCLAWMLCVHGAFTEEAPRKRPITVEDCVRTRRVFKGEIALSGDGSKIAYLVEAPNVETNKSAYLLYVRNLSEPENRENGTQLLTSDVPLYGLKWVDGDRRVLFGKQAGALSVVLTVEFPSGHQTEVLESETPIDSFSLNANGDMLVYSTQQKPKASNSEPQSKNEYADRGYSITFGKGSAEPNSSSEDSPTESAIYVGRKDAADQWKFEPLKIAAEEPLRGVRGLSLSPDGKHLTFSYDSGEVPKQWQSNPYVAWKKSRVSSVAKLVLYDFQVKTLRVALEAPDAGWGLPAKWSQDGLAFSVNSVSPIGSVWERRDIDAGFSDGLQYESYTHLFSINVPDNAAAEIRVSEILRSPADYYGNAVLYWKTGNEKILAWKDRHTYSWFRPGNPEWSEMSESRLPWEDMQVRAQTTTFARNSLGVSDGVRVMGFFERPMTPPDLYIHDVKRGTTNILTDLNPEYRNISLGSIEQISWRDKFGFEDKGLLIKPVGYDPQKRYPLVIMTKGWENEFLSDTGFHTAFPPQPLANAGFLVLMAKVQNAADVYRSKNLQGYPGKMGEAFQFIAMVEGAADKLVQLGLADGNNVGLMGFSRTSWATDFTLTHSERKFTAASSADSGLYNYGGYWFWNDDPASLKEMDDQLGGPPYGKSFDNWRLYSPAFNTEHLETPLLMEYTLHTEFGPVDAYELFVALKRQGKPVDLFYYPNGEHLLHTPFERVASLQRNLDWFRFWMQGYEGKSPAYDSDQFARWRKLREQFKDTDKHASAHN